MKSPFVSRERFNALEQECAQLRSKLERAESLDDQVDELTMAQLANAKASAIEARADLHAAQMRVLTLTNRIEELETALDTAGIKRPEPAKKRVPIEDVRRIARETIQAGAAGAKPKAK